METGTCLHCKSPVPAAAVDGRFCCAGCEAVYGLMQAQGLGRYYELAQGDVSPAAVPAEARSPSWLSPLVEASEAKAPAGGVCSLALDVQGIHCAACVWLMNETFRRDGGAVAITVNPALGKVQLAWRAGQVDVARWVEQVEAFGYRFGPSRKEPTARSTDLPLRLGLCAALAVNGMLFSLSFYFGLAPDEPEVFRLFTALSALLSTGVVAVGGWPFFRAAALGLKSGLLHLDLPIAVGIGLVYATSLWQLALGGRGDLAYFDTLNTFITLMLLGRFLQERVLERNRRYLLEDDGAESIVVRRVEGERLVSVAAPLLKAKDRLLVAPGDLVPVDALLLDGPALVSTDWITGEPTPRALEVGAEVGAGSFNAGRTAFHVEALTDFGASRLVALLRQPAARPGEAAGHMQLWSRLAKGWVVTVLALAGLGFVAWLPAGLLPAVNVAVALLVVTCPCAIGLSIPLAYELTLTRLRRGGFYARSPDLLDRLVRVRTLIFDKTGTLTLGRLALAKPEVLDGLDPETRDVAFNLAARSAHPVASLLSRELSRRGARYEPVAEVVEVAGQGVEWRRAGVWYRLGRSEWAAPGATPRRTVLARDGVELVELPTAEVLRAGAKDELGALMGHGYDLRLLSGDSPARVEALAAILGLPAGHALSGLSPEAKAAEVARLDRRDTLYLGDGVNDALAFDQALAAGTPAIDRPVMPGRSDFFLVGEGLRQINDALGAAGDLRTVVLRVLGVSVAYNLFAVSSCLSGHMSPLWAAVSMPASTVTLLGLTVLSLGRPRRAAKPAPLPMIAEAA